jgi:LacI family transcriptional regulator
MRSPKNISVRDLAEAANVSASTVSLALRNHPRIPVATRERIQELARQMGYHPHPSVVALMSQIRQKRSGAYHETIGWLVPNDRPDYYTAKNLVGTEHGRQLWEGAFERAAQLGYSLDSFWVKEPGMTGKRLSEILIARGIRGLLIPPLPQASGHLSVAWDKFAVVSLSFTMARPQFHRVVPDHHYNMQMILRAVRRRGYKRPGLVMPARYDERVQNRLRATYYFHQESVPHSKRIPVLIAEPSEAKVCAAWLKEYRPDVVIAWPGFRHIRKIPIGDPEYSSQLGVVLTAYGPEDRGFAAVDENPRQIGITGVDHLAGQLSRGETGIPTSPQTILIQGTWVEGNTLAPPPAQKASRNVTFNLL